MKDEGEDGQRTATMGKSNLSPSSTIWPPPLPPQRVQGMSATPEAVATFLAAQAPLASTTTTPSTSCGAATPPNAMGAQVRGRGPGVRPGIGVGRCTQADCCLLEGRPLLSVSFSEKWTYQALSQRRILWEFNETIKASPRPVLYASMSSWILPLLTSLVQAAMASHLDCCNDLAGPPATLQPMFNTAARVIFFLNRSSLEYNCFTIPCYFLLHNRANQPYAYTCPHIPSLLSLPPILPIPPL